MLGLHFGSEPRVWWIVKWLKVSETSLTGTPPSCQCCLVADRLKSEGSPPRGSPLAVTVAVVQREFVRHMQQCHGLRGKLHDGGALCQVPAPRPP